MERPIEGAKAAPAIAFPSLRELLHGCHADLSCMADAVERVSQAAFGTHPTLLLAHDRKCRRNLHKFANLLRQLALMPDVPVFELGHRCPEQLRAYHLSLRAGLAKAYAHGIEHESLVAAEEAHERLWHVEQAVTRFYDGLS
ncbi:MAG: hypothetical protein JNL05_04315 [Flavobacteriales bacterium]|nr:hypothetical protein [Flavobacteriales bacterium]